MLIDTDDLITLSEIARICEVTHAAVSNWRHRGHDFPEPVWTDYDERPVIFSKKACLRWLNANSKTYKLELISK